MARALNLILVALGVIGLTQSQIAQRRWRLFTYYTQLSNILAAIASALLVLVGQPAWITLLRYLSVCMLAMTFLVTTCVLVPMSGNPRWLLWERNGPTHHVLCPILSTASYVLVENHVGWSALPVPVAVTLVYGLVMLYLNYRRVVDGPYPFFKVHEQSVAASVAWTLVLLGAIAAIAALVLVVAP